eukprot:CAMPEP_0184491580 /NCGR_PEP_ID=MMETSP0113_2-20130426/20776_1 /TAXON_ID=91329 /ORGANISM="Norrisiella sphaerica, Strain BC52" /LENGTH=695 /DNA_ID=CAMNT_0026875999 /DNA_START=46 /DNA_END=2133 /DNA_ORIENTATION=-
MGLNSDIEVKSQPAFGNQAGLKFERLSSSVGAVDPNAGVEEKMKNPVEIIEAKAEPMRLSLPEDTSEEMKEENEIEGPGLLNQEERSRLASKANSPSAQGQFEFHRVPTIRNLKVRQGIENFNTTIFITHFLYHALFPLTIPIVYFFENPNKCYNYAFLPTRELRTTMVFTFQLITAVCIGIMIYLFAANDERPEIIFFVMPMCLYFAHKLMVATKYAVLDSDTHAWLSTRVIERKILQSIELNSWRQLNVTEVHHQLRYTAERGGLKLSDLSLYLYKEIYEGYMQKKNCRLDSVQNFYGIDAQELKTTSGQMAASSDINKMMKINSETTGISEVMANGGHTSAITDVPDNTSTKDGSKARLRRGHREARNAEGHDAEKTSAGKPLKNGLYKIPIAPLANKIFCRALQGYNKTIHDIVIIIIALIQSMIPLIVSLAWHGRIHNGSMMSSGQVLIGWFISWTYFYVALMFIDVGRHDNIRRARLIQAVGSLIDIDSPLSFEKCGVSIFVDLAWPHNVSSWIKLRWLLLNIGSQYRTRIAIYSSYVALVTLGLVLYVIGAIFTETLNEVTFVTVAFMLVCVGYMLGSSIWYGSATNEQYEYQSRALARIQLRLREVRAQSRTGNRHDFVKRRLVDQRLKRADRLMESAIILLDHDSRLEPVKILGFHASKELYTTLATIIAGTVFTVLLEFYLNQQD